TDLLIALWDGEEAKGIGGTGQIVREALQRGIPVVWVPWAAPGDWRLHLPVWRLLAQSDDEKGDARRLGDLVRELLLPPDGKAEVRQESGDLREEYFREQQKCGNPLHGLWGIFAGITSGDIFKNAKWLKALKLDTFRVRD